MRRARLWVCIGLFWGVTAAAQTQTLRALENTIYDTLASPPEQYKAVERIGAFKNPEALRILEELLLFRWETPGDMPAAPQRADRDRQRRLRQSKQSLARIRAKAAEALGLIGDDRSMPVLLTVIRHEIDPVVREFTLKALLRFTDLTLAGMFESVALEDPTPSNRILGISGMSLYSQRINGGSARRVLADPNTLVRLTAVKLFGATGRVDLMALILPSGYDADRSVRRRVADILGAYNTPDAGRVLTVLAHDEDHGIICSAVTGLGLNAQIPSAEYLDLVRSPIREAGVIILRSIARRWMEVTPAALDAAVRGRLVPGLELLAGQTRQKIELRRRMFQSETELEKIKYYLTEKGR
ncbi:MAG: HEAT repeat domain-containing protein [Planctomycetota bacterium]